MIQICGHTKHAHNRPQQNCSCIRGSFPGLLPPGFLLYPPAVKTSVYSCTFIIVRRFFHVCRCFPLPGAYWHCRFWLLFPFHIHFPVKFFFLFFPEVVLLWHLPVLVINVKSISSVQVPVPAAVDRLLTFQAVHQKKNLALSTEIPLMQRLQMRCHIGELSLDIQRPSHNHERIMLRL